MLLFRLLLSTLTEKNSSIDSKVVKTQMRRGNSDQVTLPVFPFRQHIYDSECVTEYSLPHQNDWHTLTTHSCKLYQTYYELRLTLWRESDLCVSTVENNLNAYIYLLRWDVHLYYSPGATSWILKCASSCYICDQSVRLQTRRAQLLSRHLTR